MPKGHHQQAEPMERIEGANPKKLIYAVVKLREWLIKNRMTVPQLAIRTGFTPQTYYNLLCGAPTMYPSLPQAFAIEWITEGYVQAFYWLDCPEVQRRVRAHQRAGAATIEAAAKAFILKFGALKTPDGVIRQKARTLARLFGVDWGEVRSRVWKDARARALEEVADISHLIEEENEEDEAEN